MLGEQSIQGNRIETFAQPRDEAHACNMVIGTKQFADWSTADTVRKLSLLFFAEDNPFETTIRSILVDLNDLKTIRNAAVHLSSTTSDSLDSLATRKLGRAMSDTNVYDFILMTDSSTGNNTVIENYMDILKSAASQIANA